MRTITAAIMKQILHLRAYTCLRSCSIVISCPVIVVLDFLVFLVFLDFLDFLVFYPSSLMSAGSTSMSMPSVQWVLYH